VFNGLCVITNVETTWFEDRQKPVKNYRFELTILDAEEIYVDWLINRANGQHIDEDSNSLAPDSWKSFLNGRINKLDLFKKEILTREDQLPVEGSVEAHILASITALKPVEFEAILVELLRSLPHVNHNITRTRLVKDGGFDFSGQFNLPFPFSYKIGFLGEAKKHSRANSIGPGMVSRLVARLARGEYGLFVTTSYYTKQAQEEVIEDGYPVRLYNGLDIINFLRELKLIDEARIKESWLNEVLKTIKND
jgi:HJR/Mrr/RecB family endonuclease